MISRSIAIEKKKEITLMKKIISTVLVCVLIVGMVFTLASCNMIFGTYEAEFLGTTTTAEFSVGKVTITDSTEVLGKVITSTYECKYKIEETDDGKTITFTYEEGADKHSVFNGTNTFETGDDGEKWIKIGLATYTKK